MSQARFIHVGDTVHYRWSDGSVSAYTVELITESDFGVLLDLWTASGHRFVVSADNKNICLAESVDGVTVGADGTVVTSKPAAEPSHSDWWRGTGAETEDEPMYTFGYVVTNAKTSEWITDAGVWSVDHQSARIFRGNEREEFERECVVFGAALRKRPDRCQVPLVEDTGQFKRPVFGYVVQSPGRLAGPDDCAKYWTGYAPSTEWSTNPLKARIFRDHESARAVRIAEGDARVLRLVEGDN